MTIINLPWGSRYEVLICRGHERLIKTAIPAFPEASEAIKAVGKNLIANLKDPQGGNESPGSLSRQPFKFETLSKLANFLE